MRTLASAISSWQSTEQVRDAQQLRDLITADPPYSKPSGQRSLAWKICLLFKGYDRSAWSKALASSRSAYQSLRSHFLKAIENPDEIGSSSGDPLSDNSESPWVALRQDELLRAEIFQDVERIMPDNLYFHQPPTQKMLVDILFVFCKLNPDVSYRQGMHEILALVLWVVQIDAVESEPHQSNDSRSVSVESMFGAQYIESDSFTLFTAIMQNAKSFYDPASTDPRGGDSPILHRCRYIYEETLPAVDAGLKAHLDRVDVLPQIFLVRWIRMIFGREFSFDDTLALWDHIFLEDPSLALLDFICIAMLLRIRWSLVAADSSEALTLLLHYPSLEESGGPGTLIADALDLKQNPTSDCGRRLIKKYSGRYPPDHVSTKSPSTSQSLYLPSTPISRAISSTNSLVQSASRSVRVETLLQDAAKGVALKSEQWGVSKAVKDTIETMKNLETPHLERRPSNARSGASQGRNITSSDDRQRHKHLEDRNKALSQLLESAISQLWAQQASLAEQSTEEPRCARLIQAIAKVHLVQVCLDDSSIPVPDGDSPGDGTGLLAMSVVSAPNTGSVATRVDGIAASASSVSTSTSKSFITARSEAATDDDSSSKSNITAPPRTADCGGAAKDLPTPTQGNFPALANVPVARVASPPAGSLNDPDSPLPRRPRAPIAQSSFAWMLDPGERSTGPDSSKDQVSQNRRAHGTAKAKGNRFLFGEDEGDEDSTASGGRPGQKAGRASNASGGDGTEAFRMGDL